MSAALEAAAESGDRTARARARRALTRSPFYGLLSGPRQGPTRIQHRAAAGPAVTIIGFKLSSAWAAGRRGAGSRARRGFGRFPSPLADPGLGERLETHWHERS